MISVNLVSRLYTSVVLWLCVSHVNQGSIIKAANGRLSLCRRTEPLKIISFSKERYSFLSLAAEGCLLLILDVVFCGFFLRKCRRKIAHPFPQFLHLPLFVLEHVAPGFIRKQKPTAGGRNAGKCGLTQPHLFLDLVDSVCDKTSWIRNSGWPISSQPLFSRRLASPLKFIMC